MTNAPIFFPKDVTRPINKIIVHCSATPPYVDVGAERIKEWHLVRGFNDIGYHYVIKRNGKLETGRPLRISGAHAKGHNSDSIGICLVGGINRQGEPENNFTKVQFQTLYYVLNKMKDHFDLEQVDIYGHRDFTDKKACPSFDVKMWYNEYKTKGLV